MSTSSASTVLLVDDDPSTRDVLQMQLEEAGFEARQAEDGIDGLAKLRDGLPGVIISDIQMPRMSGIEFVSVVRLRFPSIPVIILSGSSPVELPAEAVPDAWFEKGSLQFPELLQALHNLVRNTPDRANVPQVVAAPVRTRPYGADQFVVTCPECLRRFKAANAPENKAVERTASCPSCEAQVPFLVESPDPG